MKLFTFVVLLFVIIQKAKSQLPVANSSSATILLDEILQVINGNNYNNVANDLLGIITQLGKLDNVLTELDLENNDCFRQIFMFINGLLKKEDWALRMFDAAAKPQTGFLEGNIMQIGHYDECLKIDVVVNDTQINGQYCTSYVTSGSEEMKIDLKTKENLIAARQSYGLCIPAVCNGTSLRRLAKLVEDVFESPLHFHFTDDMCMSTVKTHTLSTAAIASISFFSIIGIIMVLSTIYDMYIYQNQENKKDSILVAFSVYSNGKKILSSKKSLNSMNCLNGMRVISIIWIILCHRWMYTSFLPLYNLMNTLELPKKQGSSIISGGNMAVDTFFLISGLLLVYVYLTHQEKGQNVSLVMFYVHRILRLTPSLATMILFYATLMDHIGDGPFWPIVVSMYQYECQQHWWSAMLYIQNYVNTESMCVGHSWYLAVDTQLYFLSPLLLFPLIKWPKRIFLVISFLIIASGIYNFLITWWKNLLPSFFGIADIEMKYLYVPTHSRITPWLVGFVLGYILFQTRNKVVKIKKVTNIFLWVGIFAILLAVIIYHQRVPHGAELSYLERSLVNTFLRPAWSVAIAVFIFLCITGYGGPINTFLSHSIFTVLIRINYNVYITHMLVIIFFTGQQRTPMYASVTSNFYIFCGDYIFSTLLATVWTLAFESPILVLEKIIFGKRKPKEVKVIPEKYNNNISVVVIEGNLMEINGKTYE